jgi:hypothetical protein
MDITNDVQAPKNANSRCRLCFYDSKRNFLSGPDGRIHDLCGKCFLISAREEDFLSFSEEKKRYALHRNSPHDEGYRNFLMQAVNPALGFLRRDMRGLDYGCGPGPALSVILKEKGFDCHDYDPFFFPEIPPGKFDFIFATETAEHFFFPGKEFCRIKELLNFRGVLVVMTQRWITEEKFSTWHYARDFTHVAFYHSRTFDFMASAFGFEKLFDDGEKVVIFSKTDLEIFP